MKKKSAYARAGVDIEKADKLVHSIARMAAATRRGHPKLATVGGYASLYPIGEGRYIAATTDGVGTKLKMAFESGIHDTVGIDLVAMSVNDLICVGAVPHFFLDYFATGKLKLDIAKQVISGVAAGCKQAGCALVGGETAEMPAMYAEGEYDLAGFAVGTVRKSEILGGAKVKAGDRLIGVASSGPHSNGFSLIRRIIKKSRQVDRLQRACFAPTRIYVDLFISLKNKLGQRLHGMAHVTGSGWLNIPRLNESMDYDIDLDRAGFKLPWVFSELARVGGLSLQELFTTFNSGIGLVVAVDHKSEIETLKFLKRSKVRAWSIGTVVRRKSAGTQVRIRFSGKNLKLNY